MKVNLSPSGKTNKEGRIFFPSDKITLWFGDGLRPVLQNSLLIIKKNNEEIEEIRLRVNQPLILKTAYNEYFLTRNGQIGTPESAYRVSQADLLETLERMTFSSLYAAEEELKQGFITLPGGHRVGITGEVVLEEGKIKGLKNISAINMRLAHDPGIQPLNLFKALLDHKKRFCNTIIISPPRAGKTTMIRLLVRFLSNGLPELGLKGQTVGVVDERGEIAGMWQGIPSFDLGCRTDVLDRSPKSIGLSMLIRSMSPSVVAADELGSPEDVFALLDAVRCGVKILATAHSDSLSEVEKRPYIRDLFKAEVFERAVVLSRKKGPGTVEKVYDLLAGKELLIFKTKT